VQQERTAQGVHEHTEKEPVSGEYITCLVVLIGGQVGAEQQAATTVAEQTGSNGIIANGFGRAWKSFETDSDRFPNKFLPDSKAVFCKQPNLIAMGLEAAAGGVS
jgi:hypothetical protein